VLGLNLCAAMVKLQMVKNTAVDPRGAEYIFGRRRLSQYYL
jgi:hypothetical protein